MLLIVMLVRGFIVVILGCDFITKTGCLIIRFRLAFNSPPGSARLSLNDFGVGVGNTRAWDGVRRSGQTGRQVCRSRGARGDIAELFRRGYRNGCRNGPLLLDGDLEGISVSCYKKDLRCPTREGGASSTDGTVLLCVEVLACGDNIAESAL